MATEVTKFPSGQLGKTFFVEQKNNIQLMIDLEMITTASTILELQTALTGEIDNDDPRS